MRSLYKQSPCDSHVTRLQVRNAFLDRDTDTSDGPLEVVVKATDLGNPRLSNSITVKVSLSDTNDKPPVFDDEPLSFEISEGREINFGEFSKSYNCSRPALVPVKQSSMVNRSIELPLLKLFVCEIF